MKKLIIATLIIAGASTAGFAQSKKLGNSNAPMTSVSSVDQKAKEETDKLAKALNLTTDQKVKIQDVNVHYQTQMDHIKQAGSAASPVRTTMMTEYKDKKYKEIMTGDQYTKYQQLSEQATNGQKPKAGSN